TVIEQSKEQGYDCYELTISLRPDCLLKTARVFMVFEVLEKCGDVIKSNPPVEQLEEEQFDSEFTVTLITKESGEDLGKKIMKISEIDSVETNLIDPLSINENDDGDTSVESNINETKTED